MYNLKIPQGHVYIVYFELVVICKSISSNPVSRENINYTLRALVTYMYND